MAIAISPNERVFTGLNSMATMERVLTAEIGDPDKEDDDPEITKIRDRLIDTVKEYDELGLMD